MNTSDESCFTILLPHKIKRGQVRQHLAHYHLSSALKVQKKEKNNKNMSIKVIFYSSNHHCTWKEEQQTAGYSGKHEVQRKWPSLT